MQKAMALLKNTNKQGKTQMTRENESAKSMITEQARLHQDMYLHCGPEHAFWELFNGWGRMMDFTCAGI